METRSVLTEAQWHMVAAADDTIKRNGLIIGVVMGDVVTMFKDIK